MENIQESNDAVRRPLLINEGEINGTPLTDLGNESTVGGRDELLLLQTI